jgi:hypothetical protein
MRRWWGQRSWAARIALLACLLTGLLLGASTAIFELQEAFVSGYTQPDLLFSDLTWWDGVGLELAVFSFATLLVAVGSALVAGLMAWVRGLRGGPAA